MEPEFRKAIGAFFRTHRLRAALEIEQASRFLSPDEPDLARLYESGEREMPAHHVFLLANLYGIAPDELVSMLYDLLMGQAARQDRVVANRP